MSETATGFDQKVLSELNETNGVSVSVLKCSVLPCDRDPKSFRRISSALQRLKKRGLAECAHGYMGWSWFKVVRPEEGR